MTDSTGHADKPGAGPSDAQYVCSHGIPSGYYTYENQSGTFEAVKISASGITDVKFDAGFVIRKDAMLCIEANHKH